MLFDDTYDVAWDTDRDMFIFQDNAILGMGGAHDATADVTFKWDTSNLLIESVFYRELCRQFVFVFYQGW